MPIDVAGRIVGKGVDDDDRGGETRGLRRAGSQMVVVPC